MMTPSTKALMDYLRGSGDTVEPELPMEQDPADDITTLTLQLKKKRHQMMLKKMLNDAGYGDLAAMTSIGKDHYTVDDEENY